METAWASKFNATPWRGCWQLQLKLYRSHRASVLNNRRKEKAEIMDTLQFLHVEHWAAAFPLISLYKYILEKRMYFLTIQGISDSIGSLTYLQKQLILCLQTINNHYDVLISYASQEKGKSSHGSNRGFQHLPSSKKGIVSECSLPRTLSHQIASFLRRGTVPFDLPIHDPWHQVGYLAGFLKKTGVEGLEMDRALPTGGICSLKGYLLRPLPTKACKDTKRTFHLNFLCQLTLIRG